MGQYYKPIILGEDSYIRIWIEVFDCGLKMMEHAYCDSPLMHKIEYLLSNRGMMYKTRVVWAGDYADNEPNSEKNLYTLAEETSQPFNIVLPLDFIPYRFIVNHTKKQYVEKLCDIHPLPILTAEGNGRGGGDYHGDSDYVGAWARDVISVENDEPNGYTKLVLQKP